MKLSEIGEFGFIERILKKIQGRSGKVLVGPGDDAAVIKVGDKLVLATSDMLVEGSHFDLGFTSAYSLGWKALAVNLSDIAAMGGVPRYGLVCLGLSSATSLSFTDSFFKGMERMASLFGVSLIGGDTVSSQVVTINVTLLGEVEKERLTLRKGAKVGEKIYVTGPLGDAACGLLLLKEGKGRRGRLVDKFLKPWPRVKEGEAIGLIASSMIDISDGLSQEMRHLCRASKVGARLYLEKIPISMALRRAVRRISKGPLSFALHGGEDYELLWTASPSKIGGQCPPYKTWEIGEIVPAGKGIKIVNKDGEKQELLPLGYEHFNK
ncbi:thiamine-phosphate kinase [bacterium]|nr:thiamine-phosphate kinase [bacterium]MBU1615009.1 thiamine-phosphate kinase [bacterium]